jgi:hypothetical protein
MKTCYQFLFLKSSQKICEFDVSFRIRFLKGQCHEIFDPFFHQTIHPGPLIQGLNKAFLNSASNSPRDDRFSDAKIVHVVSMTPHERKLFVLLGSPFKSLFFIVVGKDNSRTYTFQIDIRIKGCQGRTNRSSIVHAVSYFACGVNKTPCTLHVVSLTPHTYRKFGISEFKFIFKKALAP